MELLFRLNPVALSLAVPALISAGLAVNAFTRRPVVGSRTFACLMLALCVWSVFYGIELCCLTLDGMLACAAFEYIGIATLPVLVLILVLLFIGRGKILTGKNIALLFVVPFITIAMVATNQWHHLYYSTAEVVTSGPFPMIDLTRGPWFWVHTAYSYTALLAATILLITHVGKPGSIFRSQVAAMLAGMSVPWVVSILYVGFGLMLLEHVDPTPFAFIVTGIVIAWSMFRHGLFDILPVAFDMIVDSMDDAIVVMDREKRIVVYNKSAGKIFGLCWADIGQAAAIIWKDRPELMNLIQSDESASIEMVFGRQDPLLCYEASAYSLTDRHRHVIGRVISLHDITGRKQTEETLRENEAALTSMFNMVGTGIMVIDSETLTIILANQTAATMIGRTRKEIEGKVCHSFICPAETGKCPIRDLGQTVDSSVRNIICADGQLKSIVKSVSPWFFRGRRCYLESFIDITERMRSEEALRSLTDRLSLAARAGGVGIWDFDTVNNVLVWDDMMYRLYGIMPDSFGGAYEAWRQGLHPEDLQRGDAEVQLALRGEKEFDTEFRIVWPDGTIRNIRALAIVQRDTSGKPTHMIGTNWDITEIKRAEEALRESEEKYRNILEQMHDGYYEVDLAGNYTFVNDASCRNLGYSREELIGNNFRVALSENEAKAVLKAYHDVYVSGEPNKGFTFEVVRKDGSIGYAESSITLLKNKLGEPVGFRSVGRDITERKHLQQKLEELATHDFLTGLPNRVLLPDRFNIAAALAQRNKVSLAVMSLDLDKFKSINDTLGHQAGDQVLQAVSTRLTGIIRASDTLARVGGDEFILVMLETGGMKDTAATAQKILDSFAEPLCIDGHQLQLSTSIGIATYPEDAQELDTLVKKSDAAMYYSKGHGRNQFKFFGDGDVQVSGDHKSAT